MTMFHDDFEIKSKIDSLNCLSCFIHILNYKMTLYSGICFFLYFLKLSAGRGFCRLLPYSCFLTLLKTLRLVFTPNDKPQAIPL